MLVSGQECTGSRVGLQLLPRLVPSYSTINTHWGSWVYPYSSATEKRWAGNTQRNRENRGWTYSAWPGWSLQFNVLRDIAYNFCSYAWSWGFFILTSLSNQPVDYQIFLAQHCYKCCLLVLSLLITRYNLICYKIRVEPTHGMAVPVQSKTKTHDMRTSGNDEHLMYL